LPLTTNLPELRQIPGSAIAFPARETMIMAALNVFEK
jgi:hypothetical protein